MPRGNGMGPAGMGPKSGRAAGLCAGNGQPGYVNSGCGRGLGRGRGMGGADCVHGYGMGVGGLGRGCRNMFLATGLPGWIRARGSAVPGSSAVTEDQKQGLRSQAAMLQSELDAISKCLSESETQGVAE